MRKLVEKEEKKRIAQQESAESVAAKLVNFTRR